MLKHTITSTHLIDLQYKAIDKKLQKGRQSVAMVTMNIASNLRINSGNPEKTEFIG